jgi:hypothetical protein
MQARALRSLWVLGLSAEITNMVAVHHFQGRQQNCEKYRHVRLPVLGFHWTDFD